MLIEGVLLSQVFINSIFGYLCILILTKWTTNWDATFVLNNDQVNPPPPPASPFPHQRGLRRQSHSQSQSS